MNRKMLHNFGGNWTERKLQVIENYLINYQKVLKYQNFRTCYVDAFAGTGYRTLENPEVMGELLFPGLAEDESQEFIEGSAIRALKVEPPFSEYLFVEKSREKARALQQIAADYADSRNIKIINEEANTFLQQWCQVMGKYDRAVVFLDPFGMQVNWSTIECLARTEKVDMWYLFPAGALMRLLRNDGNIDRKIKFRINEVLGDEEWFDKCYKPSGQMSLLDDIYKDKVIGNETMNLYIINRLKTIFRPEGVVETPLPLRNSRNSVLFLLCFAAGNSKGAEIARKIARHLLKG